MRVRIEYRARLMTAHQNTRAHLERQSRATNMNKKTDLPQPTNPLTLIAIIAIPVDNEQFALPTLGVFCRRSLRSCSSSAKVRRCQSIVATLVEGGGKTEFQPRRRHRFTWIILGTAFSHRQL